MTPDQAERLINAVLGLHLWFAALILILTICTIYLGLTLNDIKKEIAKR